MASEQRAEGSAVDIASQSSTGWQRPSSANYDLIILDLMLPRIHGMELHRRLRPRGAEVSVLVATARIELPKKSRISRLAQMTA